MVAYSSSSTNRTLVAVEGDTTLPCDVTLPDGVTVLAAGTAVPDNVVAIVEVDAAGVCVSQKTFETGCCVLSSTMLDPATGEPVVVGVDTYTGNAVYFDSVGAAWLGDPTTLTLPTSTLTPNPDGTYTHTNGIGGTTVIAATTTTLVATEGDTTLPCDVTLPDATVLTAGIAVPAGVVAVVEVDALGACITQKTFETIAPCAIVVGGLTGTQVGFGVEACTLETMPAGGDPEPGFPAAGFPEGWRQYFSGGTTGTEYWTVMNDTLGALQWHQIG